LVDIETLGLDPKIYDLIEIAIIRSDGVVYSTKIKPLHPEIAHPKALACNGFRKEDWEDAPLLSEEIETIFGLLKDCIIIGQNVSFDVNFLRSIASQHNIKIEFGYHTIDTVTLAWEWLVPLGLTSLSLKNICLFLGVPPEPEKHSALNGAETCRKVYDKLLRATWWNRLLWKLANLENYLT
jgi:DNA polymerase III epsilon subunit-like protein